MSVFGEYQILALSFHYQDIFFIFFLAVLRNWKMSFYCLKRFRRYQSCFFSWKTNDYIPEWILNGITDQFLVTHLIIFIVHFIRLYRIDCISSRVTIFRYHRSQFRTDVLRILVITGYSLKPPLIFISFLFVESCFIGTRQFDLEISIFSQKTISEHDQLLRFLFTNIVLWDDWVLEFFFF